MRRHSVRWSRPLAAAALVGIAVAASAGGSTDLATETAATAAPAAVADPVVCALDVGHPLQVRIEALGPVARGQTLSLRLHATARTTLDLGRARLVSTGGAELLGAPRAELGTLRAGVPATADFAVRVPATGHRFLLQFRVEAEGAVGLASRGAVYNLLPDGPAERSRRATTASGESLIEVEAGRVAR